MKIFVLFILTFSSTFSQNIICEKVNEKLVNYNQYWGTDNLDNFYFSNTNNLYKINILDTLTYANNKFGKIYNVESLNSLQTVVFYKENNAFVLLDSQLNESNSTIFSEINCEFLKPASQNELWFFDNNTQKFGLYNINTQKIKFISNSIPIKQVVNSNSYYNLLYFIDENDNLNSINKFGKQINLATSIRNNKIFVINPNEYLFLFENKINLQTIGNNQFEVLKIDENLIVNFFFKDGILTIFTPTELITYQIKK